MTKRILLLTFCLIGFINLHVSAQKKENSADSTVEYKVNSLKGIELKFEAPHMAGYGPHGNGVPFFLDYIDEVRIAPSPTILLKAGVSITPGFFYEDSAALHGEIVDNRGIKVPFCSFGFNFVVEPRWYWNYQKCAQSGKAKLNSGWFLSVPLEISLP
ncbi:MAG TPA: hypothetical protein VI413_09135 [Paludibacter sp.]